MMMQKFQTRDKENAGDKENGGHTAAPHRRVRSLDCYSLRRKPGGTLQEIGKSLNSPHTPSFQQILENEKANNSINKQKSNNYHNTLNNTRITKSNPKLVLQQRPQQQSVFAQAKSSPKRVKSSPKPNSSPKKVFTFSDRHQHRSNRKATVNTKRLKWKRTCKAPILQTVSPEKVKKTRPVPLLKAIAAAREVKAEPNRNTETETLTDAVRTLFLTSSSSSSSSNSLSSLSGPVTTSTKPTTTRTPYNSPMKLPTSSTSPSLLSTTKDILRHLSCPHSPRSAVASASYLPPNMRQASTSGVRHRQIGQTKSSGRGPLGQKRSHSANHANQANLENQENESPDQAKAAKLERKEALRVRWEAQMARAVGVFQPAQPTRPTQLTESQMIRRGMQVKKSSSTAHNQT